MCSPKCSIIYSAANRANQGWIQPVAPYFLSTPPSWRKTPTDPHKTCLIFLPFNREKSLKLICFMDILCRNLLFKNLGFSLPIYIGISKLLGSCLFLFLDLFIIYLYCYCEVCLVKNHHIYDSLHPYNYLIQEQKENGTHIDFVAQGQDPEDFSEMYMWIHGWYH